MRRRRNRAQTTPFVNRISGNDDNSANTSGTISEESFVQSDDESYQTGESEHGSNHSELNSSIASNEYAPPPRRGNRRRQVPGNRRANTRMNPFPRQQIKALPKQGWFFEQGYVLPPHKRKCKEVTDQPYNKGETIQYMQIKEEDRIRELNAIDWMRSYNLDNFKNCKYIHGYPIQIAEVGKLTEIVVKRKDHEYSISKKYDRWRFPVNSNTSKNHDAKIQSKVFKCPGMYNKLGCEIQAYDSVREYNLYMAKFSNKVILKCKNTGTYTVEGKVPDHSVDLKIGDFWSQLDNFFSGSIRFEMKYIPRGDMSPSGLGYSQFSNIILLERNSQRAEAYTLNLQMLTPDERTNPLVEILYNIVDCHRSTNINFITFYQKRVVLLVNRVCNTDRIYLFYLPKQARNSSKFDLELISQMNIPVINGSSRIKPLMSKDLEMLVYEQREGYSNNSTGQPKYMQGQMRVFRIDLVKGFEEILTTPLSNPNQYFSKIGFRKKNGVLTCYTLGSSGIKDQLGLGSRKKMVKGDGKNVEMKKVRYEMDEEEVKFNRVATKGFSII